MKVYEDVTKEVHSDNAYDWREAEEIFQNVLTGELIGKFPNGWYGENGKVRKPKNRELTRKEKKYIESEEYFEESKGWFCNRR